METRDDIIDACLYQITFLVEEYRHTRDMARGEHNESIEIFYDGKYKGASACAEVLRILGSQGSASNVSHLPLSENSRKVLGELAELLGANRSDVIRQSLYREKYVNDILARGGRILIEVDGVKLEMVR